MALKTIVASALAAGLLLAGCGSAPVKQDDPALLARDLQKLSAAMESYMLYAHRPPGASEELLLAEGTRDNPRLLEAFSGYRLRLAREQPRALLMVCTKDGKQALMEDVGCTPKLDKRLWEQGNAPCEFTLEIKDACQRR